MKKPAVEGKARPPALPAAEKKPFAPSEKQQREIDAYTQRRDGQKPLPRIVKRGPKEMGLAPADGDHWGDVTANNLGMARLTEGLGITDHYAALELLKHLVGATNTKDGLNEGVANGMLALLSEIQPRDALEAMLAVQMVNTHGLIADLQRRVMNSVENIPQLEANGTLLTKLLRTFTAQIETLKRHRTGGEQKVHVVHQHQHVTVNADKAAVAVNPPTGGGTFAETKDQPHALKPQQLAYAPGDPMPGSLQEDQEALPATGR